MAEPSPSDSATDTTRQEAACRVAIEDADKALNWWRDPRGLGVRARYDKILQDYEQILHNVNADPMILKNAAFAVDIIKKFLSMESYFENKRKSASNALKQLQESQPKNHDEVEMTFMGR